MNQESKMKIMEVCGTHTVSIFRTGVKAILPKNVEVVSGPGCPVCVTSVSDIDKMIWLSRQKNVIVLTYGDMYRIPGSSSSLKNEKVNGSDVRIISSVSEVISIAKKNPHKEVVFIAVGFETTIPGTIILIKRLVKEKAKNVSILSLHKTIPEALTVLLSSGKVRIDGLLLPGHVGVILGAKKFEEILDKLKLPGVISGFEAKEIFSSFTLLIKEVSARSGRVVNNYTEVVKYNGNKIIQKEIEKFFDKDVSTWRGLGDIENSGLFLKRKYKFFDAYSRFRIPVLESKENPACLCGKIIQGLNVPTECKLFGKVCLPENPVGPCMVSSEGTCSAYYKYGGLDVRL